MLELRGFRLLIPHRSLSNSTNYQSKWPQAAWLCAFWCEEEGLRGTLGSYLVQVPPDNLLVCCISHFHTMPFFAIFNLVPPMGRLTLPPFLQLVDLDLQLVDLDLHFLCYISHVSNPYPLFVFQNLLETLLILPPQFLIIFFDNKFFAIWYPKITGISMVSWDQ